MMEVTHVAVAVLSFLSVGRSAPVTDCGRLIQPLRIQGREQLLGKWIFIAESTDVIGSKLLTNMFVENAWVKMAAANESDAIDNYQSQKMLGKCFSVRSKLRLVNGTISMEQPYPATAEALKSGCADCLVFHVKYTMFGKPYSGLQLSSKRTKVSAAELQEFKKQVECLNLPAPAVQDTGSGLCPEESSSQEVEVIDITGDMETRFSQVSGLTESIWAGGEGLLKTFANLFTSD